MDSLPPFDFEECGGMEKNPASFPNPFPAGPSAVSRHHQGHKHESRTAALSSMVPMPEESIESGLSLEIQRLFNMDIGALILRASHYRAATDDEKRAILLNILFNIN